MGNTVKGMGDEGRGRLQDATAGQWYWYWYWIGILMVFGGTVTPKYSVWPTAYSSDVVFFYFVVPSFN